MNSIDMQYGTDRMFATNKYFEHFYPKMPSFIRF